MTVLGRYIVESKATVVVQSGVAVQARSAWRPGIQSHAPSPTIPTAYSHETLARAGGQSPWISVLSPVMWKKRILEQVLPVSPEYSSD